MKLSDLVTEAARDPRLAALDVAGVTADSRKVKKGDLFVAVAGTSADGAQFIGQALAAGATAALAENSPAGLPGDAPFVKVPNARLALARAAAKIFPRQPGTIAAITGTSGKTSVAAFTRQIWSMLGHPAASIGTVGVVSPRGEVYGSLTTPDPVALHATLDALASEGVSHLALEASSHGLDQYRLDGVRVSTGAFTNLSRDHLDYHPDLESYLGAKLRLFSELIVPGGTAVIVAGHDGSAAAAAAARKRKLDVLTVGREGEGIRLLDARDGNSRSSFRWSAPSRSRMRLWPPGLRSRPEAIPRACLPRWRSSRAPRAGSNAPARATARPSLSITRTSRMRCRKRWKRCDPM